MKTKRQQGASRAIGRALLATVVAFSATVATSAAFADDATQPGTQTLSPGLGTLGTIWKWLIR